MIASSHTIFAELLFVFILANFLRGNKIRLKVHKIEIFLGFDFEICIISLLVMSKY